MPEQHVAKPFDPKTTTRPIPALMTYYVIVSLLTLIGFPLFILPLFFKYQSLHYRFDDEGISMSWGVLFKKEVYLTYRRIQDIHVSRGIIQRHLGLATVSVQTASGSAGAEMSIEGIGDPEGLRDYLYARMRGSRDEPATPEHGETQSHAGTPADEALGLLHEILEEIRSIKQARHGDVSEGPVDA